MYRTYTAHQLRVQIKEIRFLTLMPSLLDLQQRVLRSTLHAHLALCRVCYVLSRFPNASSLHGELAGQGAVPRLAACNLEGIFALRLPYNQSSVALACHNCHKCHSGPQIGRQSNKCMRAGDYLPCANLTNAVAYSDNVTTNPIFGQTGFRGIVL
jgi:hypothetical protein